jgi:hypothetical protein
MLLRNFALVASLLLTMPTASGEGGKADGPARDHGLPVPAGAAKNASLGGATTLAPGKNYTLIVYDVDSPLESVAAFYSSQSPGAARTTSGEEIHFSAREGTIKLARLGNGTRITLVLGPR